MLFSCSRVKHPTRQKCKVEFVAQPSRLWGQRASCPLIVNARSSLDPGSEHRLKIRTLLLPRNDAHVDAFKSRIFEELMQLNFAETEPMVRIKLARALERMAQQIENRDAPLFS